MTQNRPITYLISEGKLTRENFVEQSDAFLESLREAAGDGIDIIQIREKAISARELFLLAEKAATIAAQSDTKILISDRADIAKASGCSGVHLTTNSMPTKVVRTIVGEELLISRSTHTVDEVASEANSGADILLFGPVFATPGKGEPTRLQQLALAAKAAGDASLVALGGIDATNYRSTLTSGADGIAAIRAFADKSVRRSILEGL